MYTYLLIYRLSLNTDLISKIVVILFTFPLSHLFFVLIDTWNINMTLFNNIVIRLRKEMVNRSFLLWLEQMNKRRDG